MSTVQVRTGWVVGLRWLALLPGLALTSRLLNADPSGSTLLLVGPVLGLVLLAAVLVGALAGRPPEPGPARRALLETRRMTDYLPAAARPVATLLGLYGLLTVATITRPTGAGPLLVETCGEVFPLVAPWPDPAAVAPSLAAVLLGLAAAAAALRRLVDRPRAAGGVSVEDDDRTRRESAAAVVAACAVLVAGPLAGTCLVTGFGLVNGCGGPLTVLFGWGLFALAGAAAVTAAGALVALLRPGRRTA